MQADSHVALPWAVQNSSRQPGWVAGDGGRGQDWGDGLKAKVWGDVIYIPLTANRAPISNKWVRLQGKMI